MSYWIKNAWYVAMGAVDLAPGQMVSKMILGEPVLFIRESTGQVHGLQDRCPHRGAPLSLGKVIEDLRVQCGYHGLEFNMKGQCVRNPHGAGQIPSGCQIKTYAVLERYGMVWVWPGEGAPDLEKMPRFDMLEPVDLSTRSRVDHVRMPVPYEFIVDNLMDLSHVSFLHDGILGNAHTIAADTHVIQEGDAITVERFMQRVPPPEYHDLTFLQDGKPVDLWHNIRWEAPCNLLLDVGATRPGSPRSEGSGSYAGHFLTPETENSTLYHFIAVRLTPIRGTRESEAQVSARLAELRQLAFAGQDEPMIRAQYENVRRTGGDMQPKLLSIDAGAVRWRRVMDRLIKDEQTQGMQQSSSEIRLTVR
ncbi:vanillate O-demethylase monooxygenase subunit [Pseudomonas sp. NFACC52]|nr:vanillate O-demethylase monooxygenase subunit [Pseudomonas sp. NFACC56-3]SFK30830.1 vanillate O-demethylase monooxygenase subunit [Pseudomonas sp. NFACC52]